MIANYHLIVDFARPSKTNTIVVAENDAETRNCNFKLLFDKEPFDMTGVVTATVKGVTQRGATIWDTAEIKTDEEGNYINELSYLLPLAVTENAGNVTMTITLEGDNNQTITSFEFYIRARNTLYNEDDVIDEEDLEGFRDLLVRSQQALARMEEMVERDALPNPFPIRQTVDGYVFEYTGNEIVEVDMDDVAYLGDYAGYVEVTEDDSAAEVALQAAAEAAESARVAAESVEGVDETAQEVRNIVDNLESIIPTANVTKTGHTATITVQDQHGTTTAEVEDGQDGQDGAVGVTPSITAVVTVDDNTGTPSCTVTKTGTDEAPTLTFEFENLKGEKGDPGSGSSVEWGEVYGDIEDQSDLKAKLDGEIDLLQDTVGWTGKNLIPFPYKNGGAGETLVTNGITFTVNADGSVDVNGTAAASPAYFRLGIATEDSNPIWLENGKSYILSGSGNSNVNVWLRNSNNTGVISANVTDATYDCNSSGKYYALLQVNSGATISHLVVYPMLRLASVNDATYEPYHKPVSEWAYTRNEASILGAKNFVKFPYSNVSQTINNVTFTVNDDGTVLINTGTGGASAGTAFNLISTANADLKDFPEGRLKLSTNINVSSGIWINIVRRLNGTNINQSVTASNTPVEFDWSHDGTAYNGYNCEIYISKNIEVSNLLIKPLVRLATDADGTYQPYAETNYQLTHNKLSYKDNAITGVHNLLPYPYSSTTKTQDGVTFTDNGDGTVLINIPQTATNKVNFWCYVFNIDYMNLSDGTYIISKSGHSDIACSVAYYLNSTWKKQINATENDETFVINKSDTSYNNIGVVIYVPANTTSVSNLLIKPMIRLASDTDDTWQPYAMTNQELTDANKKLTDGKVSKTGDTITGTLILSRTIDASGTVNNKPALIVGGTDTQPHIEIDSNEIMAKADGTTTSELYLNNEGGLVWINHKIAGKFTSTPTDKYVLVADGTEGNIKSISTLPIAQGGTGATDAATARTKLGVPATSDLSAYAPKSGVKFTGDVNVQATLSVTDGTSYRGFQLDHKGSTPVIDVTAPIRSNYGVLELSSLSSSYGIVLTGNYVDVKNYDNTAFGTLSAGTAHITTLAVNNSGRTDNVSLTYGATGVSSIKGLAINGALKSSFGWLYLSSVNASSGVCTMGNELDVKNYANSAFVAVLASAFTVASSRRYKENILDLTKEDARKILELNTVVFDYKKDAGIAEEKDRYNHTGLIAEDAIDICPEIVRCKEVDGEEIPDSIDYTKLIPRMLKIIQLQEERIAELERRINNEL